MDDRERFLDQFDTDAAAEIVHARTKNKPCPMCDTNDWRIEVRQKGNSFLPTPTFLLKDTGAWFGPSPSIPAIAFSCGHCGFVRLHNIPLLTATDGDDNDGTK